MTCSEERIFMFKCSTENRKLISELGNSVCLEPRKKRIVSLIEALDECELDFLHKLKIDEKQSDKSKILRLEGNRYFQSTEKGSLDKAVEEYTKAVAHAPNGSEDLGLAYANRSAALFKARLISDCLLDIGRALENNYPDNLKAKLFLRKAMCLQILESNNDSAIEDAFNEVRKWTEKMDEKNQRIMKKKLEEQEHAKSIDKSTFSKWPYKKFMPKLDAENSMIPGLSDAIELKYSKKYGRHLVATRDIKPGELICLQKSYANSVFCNSRYYLCWNCGEQTWASLPCERCVEVVFCSEACREKADQQHHKIECPIISYLMVLEYQEVVFLPLRSLMKAFREAQNSFDNLKNNIQEIDDEKNPLMKGFRNNKLDPSGFASIYSLELSSNKDTESKASAHALLVAFLLATKTDFFGSKLNEGLGKLKTRDNFIFIVALLEKIIMISIVNRIESSGLVNGNKTHLMMVPVFSFFNHSCNSMIYNSCHSDYMANIANIPIKKGQQIFANYGQSFMKEPIEVRRKYYSDQYCFFCDCEACEFNWPQKTISEFSGLKPENLPVATKLSQNTFEIRQRSLQVQEVARSFGPKHGKIYDSKKDINTLVGIIEAFHRLGFKPFSYEIRLAESLLEAFLILNENRYLSLN